MLLYEQALVVSGMIQDASGCRAEVIAGHSAEEDRGVETRLGPKVEGSVAPMSIVLCSGTELLGDTSHTPLHIMPGLLFSCAPQEMSKLTEVGTWCRSRASISE